MRSVQVGASLFVTVTTFLPFPRRFRYYWRRVLKLTLFSMILFEKEGTDETFFSKCGDKICRAKPPLNMALTWTGIGGLRRNTGSMCMFYGMQLLSENKWMASYRRSSANI